MLNQKGAELLKKVIIKKYGEVKLDKLFADENEFYFEFKIDDNIGEKDLQELEKEITNESNDVYVKLLRISGVYYEGNIENEMINRIFGKAFSSNKELVEYEEFLEEAKERDHNLWQIQIINLSIILL